MPSKQQTQIEGHMIPREYVVSLNSVGIRLIEEHFRLGEKGLQGTRDRERTGYGSEVAERAFVERRHVP